MINIYKTSSDQRLIRLQETQKDCWIEMNRPDWTECNEISSRYGKIFNMGDDAPARLSGLRTWILSGWHLGEQR